MSLSLNSKRKHSENDNINNFCFSGEFNDADFGDKRLNSISKKTYSKAKYNNKGTLKDGSLDKNMIRKCSRFLNNEKVTKEKISDLHYKKTIERIIASKEEEIYVIIDITTLDFTTHPSKKLNVYGKTGKTPLRGLHIILSIVLDSKNNILGVIDFEIFDYPEKNQSDDSKKIALEEKTSYLWIKSVNKIKERLKDINTKIIIIEDRGADNLKNLDNLLSNNIEFVIRCKGNRRVINNESEEVILKNQLDKQKPNHKLEIKGYFNKKKIPFNVKVKVATVSLIKNTVENGKKVRKLLKINAVQSYCEECSWIIYTNSSVKKKRDIRKVIERYKKRWVIEDFFKVLKTGCGADKIRLYASHHKIKNHISMLIVSACRLHYLTYTGREADKISAEEVFERHECEAIFKLRNKPIPEFISLKDMVMNMSKLSGYELSKYGNAPGIIYISSSLAMFRIIGEMYKNSLKKDYEY